jgi:hypothetical protein
MENWEATPSLATRVFIANSAMGERQILPWHTKSIFTISKSPYFKNEGCGVENVCEIDQSIGSHLDLKLGSLLRPSSSTRTDLEESLYLIIL